MKHVLEEVEKGQSLTILVVDRQKIFQHAVSYLLRDWFPAAEVITTSLGSTAVEFISAKQIDLIILDFKIEDRYYKSIIQIANQKTVSVIVLTRHIGLQVTFEALREGVHGILHKDDDVDELARCIKAVLKDKTYYGARVGALVKNYIDRFNETPKLRLSRREKDILRLMRSGHTSDEIASSLKLRLRTITTYREELLAKTCTKNAAELIAYAIDNAII